MTMTLNRRHFLKTAASGVALASLGSAATLSCSPSTNDKSRHGGGNTSELKLSFQESVTPGNSLNEKLDYLESLGIVGFEPSGEGLVGRVDEIKQALAGRNIRVSAVCAGAKGFILSTEEAVRQDFFTSMKELLAAAGELGSVGVIMVPAFVFQTPAYPHTQEIRDFLCEKLNELGTYAAEHGTTVILEPLNRREAFHLRQVADAASICRDVNNPGVKCMGDFWHMTWEEPSDSGAFFSAGKDYLQHVHIASRKQRNVPGEDGDADNYVDGFVALKAIGYDKYVSYECGCAGDRLVALPASVKLLREQWEKA
jgi:sugar phosphate isomerase/epimerase